MFFNLDREFRKLLYLRRRKLLHVFLRADYLCLLLASLGQPLVHPRLLVYVLFYYLKGVFLDYVCVRSYRA